MLKRSGHANLARRARLARARRRRVQRRIAVFERRRLVRLVGSDVLQLSPTRAQCAELPQRRCYVHWILGPTRVTTQR